MIRSFFAAIIILFAIGCSNATNDKTLPAASPATAASEVKKDSFFPVTSFIKGQLKTLDSIPITPLRTIKINDKTDSVWVKKADLANLLAGFISPEIRETNLVKYFKETSFNDQTLNAITFTYDPLETLPDSILLRHWDVYIDPQTGKISKVYMVKQLKEKEGNITQQLTWKTDKWAMIVSILNKPDGTTQLLKEDKIIWDFNQ